MKLNITFLYLKVMEVTVIKTYQNSIYKFTGTRLGFTKRAIYKKNHTFLSYLQFYLVEAVFSYGVGRAKKQKYFLILKGC